MCAELSKLIKMKGKSLFGGKNMNSAAEDFRVLVVEMGGS